MQDLARKCNVVGQIENLRDGYSVEIICEGEEGNVDEFVKEIEAEKGKKASFNPFVEVEDIKVLTEEPTGKFTIFEIKFGRLEEEIGERFDMAVKYLGRFSEQTKEDFKHLDERYEHFAIALESLSKTISENLKDMNENIKKLADKITG